MSSVFFIKVCTTAIPVTAEVGKIKFDPLESDALKLRQGKKHLMSKHTSAISESNALVDRPFKCQSFLQGNQTASSKIILNFVKPNVNIVNPSIA